MKDSGGGCLCKYLECALPQRRKKSSARISSASKLGRIAHCGVGLEKGFRTGTGDHDRSRSTATLLPPWHRNRTQGDVFQIAIYEVPLFILVCSFSL